MRSLVGDKTSPKPVMEQLRASQTVLKKTAIDPRQSRLFKHTHTRTHTRTHTLTNTCAERGHECEREGARRGRCARMSDQSMPSNPIQWAGLHYSNGGGNHPSDNPLALFMCQPRTC